MEQPPTTDLMLITEDDVISISSSSSESSSNNTNNNNNNINIIDDNDPEQEDIDQRKLIYQEKLASTLIDAKLEELASSGGKAKETFDRFCEVLSAGRLKAGHFACGGQLDDSMNFPGIEIHDSEDNNGEKSSVLLPLP